MTFRVGQRVVCVDDDFFSGNFSSGVLPTNLPKNGIVYTIRSFEEARGRVFVRLCEIINQHSDRLRCEPAFDPDRFRPIVERKTSIEIFTAMLNPNKTRVDA